jgi:hypothetical protein
MKLSPTIYQAIEKQWLSWTEKLTTQPQRKALGSIRKELKQNGQDLLIFKIPNWFSFNGGATHVNLPTNKKLGVAQLT